MDDGCGFDDGDARQRKRRMRCLLKRPGHHNQANTGRTHNT